MTNLLPGNLTPRNESQGLQSASRSFTSCAANGARFPPETPRSRFDDCRCQGLGRVGEMKQGEGEDW